MTRKSKNSATSSSHLQFALLCDGVRREATGQETIIGLYSDKYTMENYPVHFTPTLYLRFAFSKIDEYVIQLNVSRGKNLHLLPTLSIPIPLKDGQLTQHMVIGPIPITIDEPSVVEFTMKEGNGEWETVYSIAFLQGVFTLQPFATGLVATASPPQP